MRTEESQQVSGLEDQHFERFEEFCTEVLLTGDLQTTWKIYFREILSVESSFRSIAVQQRDSLN